MGCQKLHINTFYPTLKVVKGDLYGQLESGASAYRYGFNGKESDDEVSGEGNIYDYGFRIYNPRIAKFLSVDPLTPAYPWYTPYQFAGNMPIVAIDLDGLEEYIVHRYFQQSNDGYNIIIRLEYILPSNQREGTVPNSYDLFNHVGNDNTSTPVLSSSKNNIMMSSSIEFELSELGVNGRYLNEGNENVNYTLKSSVSENNGEYMIGTYSKEPYNDHTNSDKSPDKYFKQPSKIFIGLTPTILSYIKTTDNPNYNNKEEGLIRSTTKNLLLVNDLSLNINTTFTAGQNIDDAKKLAEGIKQKMIEYAKSQGADSLEIESLEKRIIITSSENAQSQVRASFRNILVIPPPPTETK
jgi:RHS repeat-associated protein